jgi:tetratricopeptide (TPR) repeat protein
VIRGCVCLALVLAYTAESAQAYINLGIPRQLADELEHKLRQGLITPQEYADAVRRARYDQPDQVAERLRIRAATEALRRDPQDAVAYLQRGLGSMNTCLWEEARTDFEAALRLDPKFSRAYYRRAQVRYRLKEYAEAWTDFDKALELEPKFLPARLHLVLALVDAPDAAHPDLRRARMAAEKACEITGRRDAECLQILAAVHARTGDFDKAVQWQKLALQLLPEKEREGFPRRRLERYEKGRPNNIDFDKEKIDAARAPEDAPSK